MSTLVIKLSSLFIKQLSKPLASTFTSFVLAHPGLRTTTVKAARVRCSMSDACSVIAHERLFRVSHVRLSGS
jgi:hypothetical protein